MKQADQYQPTRQGTATSIHVCRAADGGHAACGIMAGVAATKYRTALEMTHLECVAKRLAADLRRARSEAQQVSASRSIDFDLADSS